MVPLVLLPGAPAPYQGAFVARGPKTGWRTAAWRTAASYSCPPTRRTPPRTCCIGSWRASAKAGTSLTGERTRNVLVNRPRPRPVQSLSVSHPRLSVLQQPEWQEVWRLVDADAHVGRRRKLRPHPRPPAGPALHPGPGHASSAPSEHFIPVGGGLPQAGGGLHEARQTKVRTPEEPVITHLDSSLFNV